jgi:hypothetical protein
MAHKQVSRKTLKRGNSGWALALERAELALYKNRARKAQIIQAIRFFQEQIKTGTPWPVKPKYLQKGKKIS